MCNRGFYGRQRTEVHISRNVFEEGSGGPPREKRRVCHPLRQEKVLLGKHTEEIMSDCEARGGCVYVKVRPDEDVEVCKNCGQAKPELNEGDEGKK